MLWRWRRTAANACAFFCLLLCLAGLSGRSSAAETADKLQLEVFINDAPVNAIGSFVMLQNGRMAAAASELEELGIEVPAGRKPSEIVALDDVHSVRYIYDERQQRLSISMDNAQRKKRIFDVRGKAATESPPARSAFGTVVNYNLLSTTSSFTHANPLLFSGTALTLDARTFSPYGVANQSAIVRSNLNQTSQYLRLDSSYRFSDPETLMSYRAGDAITGGLAWTRPIRIGGFQAQRSFSLRPDLITTPLASLGGTAAVPSTVDLYVNNIRTFSENVGPGPFSLANVPVVTGAGNARIVVRDAAGHETSSNVPFYSSPNLLAAGLSSFSVEAGVPRLSYGSIEDNYLNSPVASATLRRGIFDGLTLEMHAEGGNGLANGGVGASFLTGPFGVASAAISGSSTSNSSGMQTYAGYETNLFGIQISLSSQRAFGSYSDLASITARLQNASIATGGSSYGLPGFISVPATKQYSVFDTTKPPRSLERITLGIPLPFDTKSSLSASYVRMRDDLRGTSDIVTGSWSKALPNNASIFASVFSSSGATNNFGAFGGLSIAFDNGVSASSSISRSAQGTTTSVDAVKPIGTKDGSYGWRVRDSEGPAPYREASAGYRSSFGRIQVGAAQNAMDSRGLVEVDGAVVAMAGGVFASNRVDDAFAVVKTGIPNVPVLQDNREIGKTDSQGRLLIPTLRSYQGNKITIDPTNLPVDIAIDGTREIVKPADRSGVVVDFMLREETSAALVGLITSDGVFIPPGSVARLENGEEFAIGYEGRAYLTGLADQNTVRVALATGECVARFPFKPQPGQQVSISPVICQ